MLLYMHIYVCIYFIYIYIYIILAYCCIYAICIYIYIYNRLYIVCTSSQYVHLLNSVLFDIDIGFLKNFNLLVSLFILWRRVRHTNYIWSPLQYSEYFQKKNLQVPPYSIRSINVHP